MRYFCADSQPAFGITQPRFAELVGSCAPRLNLAVLDHDPGEEGPANRDPDSFTSLAGNPGEFTPRPPDPMAAMSVQYTSGTTSRPKGVVWTHANALWAARVNALHEDLHPSDCHLTYLPLFHANALGYQMLASMWVGALRPGAEMVDQPVLERLHETRLHLAVPHGPLAPRPGCGRDRRDTGCSAPACATPPSMRRTASRQSTGGT
jgi:acyl-CoA synthetase (AMP-forming)/AMP-acid ligase II